MAQITIYLPDEIEKKVRNTAKAYKKPVSRWIAEQIKNKVEDAWPQSWLDAAGAFPDFPDADELREGHGPDLARESFD